MSLRFRLFLPLPSGRRINPSMGLGGDSCRRHSRKEGARTGYGSASSNRPRETLAQASSPLPLGKTPSQPPLCSLPCGSVGGRESIGRCAQRSEAKHVFARCERAGRKTAPDVTPAMSCGRDANSNSRKEGGRVHASPARKGTERRRVRAPLSKRRTGIQGN